MSLYNPRLGFFFFLCCQNRSDCEPVHSLNSPFYVNGEKRKEKKSTCAKFVSKSDLVR